MEHIKLLQLALSRTVSNHNAISSNIANVDTPGYQAKPISFELSYQQALRNTNSSHLSGLSYVSPGSNNLDHNTVDIDNERANLAKNSVQQEALLMMIQNHFSLLKSAVTGV